MKRTAVFLSSTLLIGIAIGLASFGTFLNAQQAPPTKRTDLLTNDLAGIAGKRVTIYRVEVPPGVAAGRHRHPVDAFVYVLEGDPDAGAGRTETTHLEGRGGFSGGAWGHLQREEHRHQPPHAPADLAG